jgi:predicted lipoprotein with Yx(FWY)xxD motif
VSVGVAYASPSAGTATVKVSSESALGTKILVSAKGLTLYHFVPETKGAIKCTGSCAAEWPPLVVASGAKPVAGPGLSAAKLGTIKRPDGKLQVTYNGLALYRYGDDHKSGQIEGQGEDGIWYVVTPAGKVSKAKPKAAAAANTTNDTSTPAAGGQTPAAGAAGGAGAGGGDMGGAGGNGSDGGGYSY